MGKEHLLLKAAFDRKCRKNPQYSLRALARRIKVSHSYLSRVMAGKKPIPMAHFEAIADALELDEAARRTIRKTQLIAKTRLKGIDPADLVNESPLADYHEMTEREFSILDKWYYLALLELITCSNFRNDPAWISERIGIRLELVQPALFRLKEARLIEEVDGSLKKTSEKIRFPTRKSHSLVRGYHRSMIQLAMKELESKVDERSFEERSIQGLTLSANPMQIQKARERLTEALYEVANILSDGECTEVFQLNAQLFPLTRTQKASNNR